MRAIPDVLCLDLGGTGLKGAIVRSGEIIKRVFVRTDISCGRRGIEETFSKAFSVFSEKEYDAVALSSAGDIDSEKKAVTFATDLLPVHF